MEACLIASAIAPIAWNHTRCLVLTRLQVQKFSALLHSAGAAAPDGSSAFGRSLPPQQHQRAGLEPGVTAIAQRHVCCMLSMLLRS